MMHSPEPRVSSSQDSLSLNNNSSVSALVKRLHSGTATQPASSKDSSTDSNEEEEKVLALLPWLPEFSMLSRFSLGSRNIKQLKRLTSTYLRNISEMVKKSLKKTVRATKLKKNMAEVLIMFHMMYIDIREPFEHGPYLDNMSDLLAMYLDMEIRSYRQMKETLPNVVSRLTMYLHILLGNSETHILETILKARLFTKHNEEICVPIIRKVVGSAKSSSLQTMLYVRYILVYKLWKRLVSSGAEKVHINRQAVQKLVAPPTLQDKSAAAIFVSVLPKKPKNKKNDTLFFMQAKFDLKKSVQAFLKLLKETHLSDFPGVTTKKHTRFSSPPSFLDKENNLVCGDDSIGPFDDIWSSISSIDADFAEEVLESSKLAVKNERAADVTSTQKSPKVNKLKNIKGKNKVLTNKSQEKKKIKNNPQKLVKACTTLSLNCASLNSTVNCNKDGKKTSNEFFQKEISMLTVVDLASSLKALSTVDNSVSPDCVLATSCSSPREGQSLQYENLSSTTSMESLSAGIPTPPDSLPPPVAEQIPPTSIQAPVSGVTTSLEALLEGLPRKREQPDSDNGDREMAETKCNVQVLGNAADSSENTEVREIDNKHSIFTSSSVNTASVAEGEENSGCVSELGTNIKEDLEGGENRPASRDSSVICLGSEMDIEENMSTLCMDIALEEEHCVVEDLSVQPERTVETYIVECAQAKTVESGVCVIQNVSDIVKVDAGEGACVADGELSPLESPAGHATAHVSASLTGNATSSSVISVVGEPATNSLNTELLTAMKADTMLTNSLFDEPPAVANNSFGNISGAEDSLSHASVSIISAADTVVDDIDVAEVVVSTSSAVIFGSRNIVGTSESGSELQVGENSLKSSTATSNNVIVPCTSSNVAMLPSNDLAVIDDDQSSDDVQIISEYSVVSRREPFNGSRARDNFTRLQKDFFNSAESDSDVEILEGLAKDTSEGLNLSHERAPIARVEHRNELVVEQVLSGQFPVTLDLDNSQATLAVDLNFCSAPPDSPPLNGGTMHFNESPIANKTESIVFGLYEKTSDNIQAGSTDPWLTESTDSFSYNFSRFSPVQETAPEDFLNDDADLSDDAYSAYNSHLPRFSEGGKHHSEEFRTKNVKEVSENLRNLCNGMHSSAVAIEESRTVPRPVSPVLQKESEQSVPLCSRKPSEKSIVRFPQVNTVRHLTSSLPCDQQDDKSDGDGNCGNRDAGVNCDGESMVEPPCKVIRTCKSSSSNEEAGYFRQISSVQLEHLSQETVAAQQPPPAREASPATKALDEAKEPNKQAPKASPRGMCVDGDNDKLDKTISNYTGMPSIHPFPSIPTAPLGFSYSPYLDCCCLFCCMAITGKHYPGPFLHRYVPPPETESDNQALLKEIEKSLSAVQAEVEKSLSSAVQAEVGVDKDEQHPRYPTGKESSLPLKKRLKSIPPEQVKPVSDNQSEVHPSCENLPSYQSHPLISIAELPAHNISFRRFDEQLNLGKTPQYAHNHHHNNYYSNYQMPDRNAYPSNVQVELMQQKSYPLELLHNAQDCNYKNPPEASNKYKNGVCYSTNVPVSIPHSIDANMNCVIVPVNNNDACRKQFKTPAELKQIPSMPDSLKELSAMTYKSGPCQTPAGNESSPTPIANLPSNVGNVDYLVPSKESKQVLDLSVIKNMPYQKGGRKRKPNSTFEYSAKYSRKRCKTDSATQATEIVDGFRVPYEKKRRKKNSSR